MNILIQMGDSYPDESPCAKRMRPFYDSFIAHGHKVTILAPLTNNSILETPDVKYCSTIKLRKKTPFWRLLNSLSFAWSSFWKSLTLGKVDVVITTAPPPFMNISGWMISILKRAKLVYDVRDIWPDVALEMGSFAKDSFYCKVFASIRDFMLKHSDLTTAVSPGKVKKLQEYCPSAKVIEICNGLDEEFLKNTEDTDVISKYELNKGFICSYIGNLGLAQGLTQLLDIAFKAKEEKLNVRFLLFGSGAEEDLLKQRVAEQQLSNVLFPGRIPNKQIYTILRYSDISFISLVNENLKDSVPTKLYEALGVGSPVLLAACGDSADILNDCKLGISVKPNDSDALWSAFYSMYQTIDNIKTNRENARNIILQKHSRQKAAEQMEKNLVKLMEEK